MIPALSARGLGAESGARSVCDLIPVPASWSCRLGEWMTGRRVASPLAPTGPADRPLLSTSTKLVIGGVVTVLGAVAIWRLLR